MIYSMTGFGRAAATKDGTTVTVEIRSLNHKNLDINLKTQKELYFLEDKIRSKIASKLSRGHLDVFITYEALSEQLITLSLDNSAASQYVKMGKELSEIYGVPFDLTASKLLSCEGVVVRTNAEADVNKLEALVMDALSQALDIVVDMRRREGERLHADISEKLLGVESIYEKIVKRAPQVEAILKEKYIERIKSLLKTIPLDHDRLYNEIAILLDKICVDEELTRIAGHITELRSTLEKDSPVGRRLDFIIQELNREFNTTGSKANDPYMSELVITAKTEIEKIREQVQNVE